MRPATVALSPGGLRAALPTGYPINLEGAEADSKAAEAALAAHVPLVLFIVFTLLMLQGWSELVKRIAFLQGLIDDPTRKPVEKTAEEELAEAIRKLAESKTSVG